MTLPGADDENVRERLADGPEVGDVEILRKPGGPPIERAAYDESKHERGTGDKGGQFVSMGEHSGGRAGENKPAPPPPSKKPPPGKGNGGGSGTRTRPGSSKRRASTGPVKPVGAGKRRGPMKRHGDNDPEAVRQLQALLGVLGLGKPSLNGEFDQATEDAVKAAQERLGLKPTGRASSALVGKLIAAHALSPCVKRSADGDGFDLLRTALAAGDYDDDEEEELPAMDDSRPLEWGYSVTRAYPLEDISILRNGDGRTVEAYAAIWDTPAEVRDQHGHYTEVIARGAFDRAIGDLRPREGRETWRVGVFYNHGFTIHGTPSELDSVPIGSPVDIRSDARGLYTVTRFNNTDRAEQVLESIRNGDISSYSFRGAVHESRPFKVPRRGPGQALPTVTRTRLGLTEYGPTPSAVYSGAAIMAVRSLDSLAYDLAMLDERERIELAEMIAPTVGRGRPYDHDDDGEEEDDAHRSAAPDDPGLGAEDLPAGGRSGRQQTDIARQIRAEQIRRGIK